MSMTPERRRQFGERVRVLRTLARFSQRELADKLQIDNSLIARYERGQRIPDRDRLLEILTTIGRRRIPMTPQDVNDILELVGYANLSTDEASRLFGPSAEIPDRKAPGKSGTEPTLVSSQPSLILPADQPREDQPFAREERFDYLVIVLWLGYLEVLELWHNLSGEIARLRDVNWYGVAVPLISL